MADGTNAAKSIVNSIPGIQNVAMPSNIPARTHYLDEPDPFTDPKTDGEQTSATSDEDESV